jgi:hypothetical protein
MKGIHACAIGSFEAHVETNAGGRTAFPHAIEYPEHRCCSSTRAIAAMSPFRYAVDGGSTADSCIIHVLVGVSSAIARVASASMTAARSTWSL